MSITNPEIVASLGLRLRGKITLPPDATSPSGRTIIIQGATEETANARDAAGRPIMIYDQPEQIDPKTTSQQLRRDIMAEAVEYYRNAPTPVRASYNDDAKERRITTWNAMMSGWLTSHNDRTRSHWDNDSSIWDAGISIWRSRWDGGATIYDDGISLWLE